MVLSYSYALPIPQKIIKQQQNKWKAQHAIKPTKVKLLWTAMAYSRYLPSIPLDAPKKLLPETGSMKASIWYDVFYFAVLCTTSEIVDRTDIDFCDS